MLEWLDSVDRAIFLFVNVQLANPVTDFTMPILTSNDFLRISYAIAAILLLWKGNRQLRWAVLFSALTLLATDQLSANFLKDYFDRPRPCHTLTDIHLLVNCGAGFSMPSAHAANAFGQAGMFMLLARKYAPHLLIFAALVALSRVFVGVHYPFDIVVGMVIGLVIGMTMSQAATMTLERLRRKPLQP